MLKTEFANQLKKELDDWLKDDDYISQDDELEPSMLWQDFVSWVDAVFNRPDPTYLERRKQLVRDLINQARADEASRQTGG